MTTDCGVPLTLSLRGTLAALVEAVAADAGHARLSEHSFANLFLFRRVHGYRFHPHPVPHVTGRTYDGARHLFPLVALDERSLARLAPALADGTCLYPVAAWQLASLDPERFEWTAHPADADYLYPAQNFRDYRGKRLAPKRNLVRQLLRDQAMRAEPWSPALADDCRAILAAWMADRGKAGGEADEVACLAALRHAPRLGLHGFVHYADGDPAGFVLAEPFADGTFVMRFAKGRDRFKGIYPWMFQHFCGPHSRDVRWVNFEQDLGLATFRQTKRSYAPSAQLAKYRVRLRSGCPPRKAGKALDATV